ncbi:hypothetical protein P5G62_005615 [Neobacillus sp. 179-C4.2 HS]|uniref:Lipoprotein n=1 Tax=Neobacillus driksii TaxID=3035913 RepID=A0ABV4YP97_9BACI|nr:hypothetical protein [Neobacillus sp. 179.-C4.2 HS]MDP5197169.1 hypothetical protein [Neobacillus sp. 179.-C4.2 HS]
MNKTILLSFLLFIFLLSGCSKSMDYTLLKEDEIKEIPDVLKYVNELQSKNDKYKGYKVFNTSDGDKIVVISSGIENKTLKINEANKSSSDTALTVVETEITSGHKNSYIVVKIDEIVGAFYVFERVQYEGSN